MSKQAEPTEKDKAKAQEWLEQNTGRFQCELEANLADLIASVRAEAIEKAAKVAEGQAKLGAPSESGWRLACRNIAMNIRALAVE